MVCRSMFQNLEKYDRPNLIMTYTAILSLCILRDDLSQLDKKGLVTFLRTVQKPDGR